MSKKNGNGKVKSARDMTSMVATSQPINLGGAPSFDNSFGGDGILDDPAINALFDASPESLKMKSIIPADMVIPAAKLLEIAKQMKCDIIEGMIYNVLKMSISVDGQGRRDIKDVYAGKNKAEDDILSGL